MGSYDPLSEKIKKRASFGALFYCLGPKNRGEIHFFLSYNKASPIMPTYQTGRGGKEGTKWIEILYNRIL